MSPVSSKETLREFLDRKFLDWQRDERERKTLAEFAEWLGISPNTLNNWLRRDRLPKGANIELLASKLGPEIYDVLGLPRPDPNLKKVIQGWGALPAKERRALANRVGQYAGQRGDDELDEMGSSSSVVDRVLDDVLDKLIQKFGDQIDPQALEEFKLEVKQEREGRAQKKKSGDTGPLVAPG